MRPDGKRVLLAVGVGAAAAYFAARYATRVEVVEPLEPIEPKLPPVAKPGLYDFAFRDRDWLLPGQSLGGRAYVPVDLGAHPSPAPLLVYLHGLNPSGPLHLGLGAPGNDLRKLSLGRIVAAPSQTSGGPTGATFPGFDLEAFVDAVERATGAAIDRKRVVLAGHSGGACGLPGGGIYGSYGAVSPEAVIALDGCLDPRYGAALGKLGERVPVYVYYQRQSWTSRDIEGARKAFAGRGTFEEIKGVSHESIVPAALERALSTTVSSSA